MAIIAVFTATLFLSAGLLFSVQPMIGKMILPWLGGTPAVWNTCLVFFQASLLLGYLYAHLSTRWFSVRLQIAVHAAVLLLPLLSLPIALRGNFAALSSSQPVLSLFVVLFLTAGLPFLTVAASAPLLQKWFAQTGHPSAADPYFLYAGSNAGSLIALLGYPLLFEPTWTLAEQSRHWRNGYLLLMGLIFVCAALLWRSRGQTTASEKVEESRTAESVAAWRRVKWVVYAFIPSSLMLGVTTYITTDLASFPLLWAIPLALYLLTFILVFARRQLLPVGWMSRVLALLAVPAIIALIVEANYPHYVLIPEHLILFFTASMVCHGALAGDRPSTSHLTEYYLWMSAGGVLGGIFSTLIAPLVFNGILEYPLAIVLACFFRPVTEAQKETSSSRRSDWMLPAGIALLTALLAWITRSAGIHTGQFGVLLTFAAPAVLVLSFADRPVRYALGLAALLAGGAAYLGPLGQSADAERNFFGVVRITDDPSGARRMMVHGNTVHGSESLDTSQRGVPLTYYHPSGPAGDVFEVFQTNRAKDVGVVGLGAGSLASYAKPDESWTFFEINPAVVRFARTSQYFSFLSDSRTPGTDIVLGDARLSLNNVHDGAYGLLVLDAFSSDAIPVHLMTREALELYFDKLTPGGILAFHITNRYLRLEPVLGRLAAELGAVARTRNELDSGVEIDVPGREPSQWLVMARSERDLGSIQTNPLWRAAAVAPETPVWTDDFSNIVSVLRW
jgi:hypothetical protein